MPSRMRLTRMFLWISVLAWGLLLGGKLFDLRVLVGAWSASPPESLSLLPYGPRFPVDTGDYFFPSSVALLVCSFGGLIAGWNTPWRFRLLLALPAVMLLVTLLFTVLWFWPANGALWAVASGAPNAMQDQAEIIRLVRRWVNYDWVRVAVASVAFVLCVRAISVPFPLGWIPGRSLVESRAGDSEDPSVGCRENGHRHAVNSMQRTALRAAADAERSLGGL